MKWKFNLGDEVEIITSGGGFRPEAIGSIVTILDRGYYGFTGKLGYKTTTTFSGNGNPKDDKGKFKGWVSEDSFKLVNIYGFSSKPLEFELVYPEYLQMTFDDDAIYVPENEYEDLLLRQAAHKAGYNWYNGDSYLEQTYYGTYREGIYYQFTKGEYGGLEYFKYCEQGKKIIYVNQLLHINKQSNENGKSTIESVSERKRSRANQLSLRGHRRFHSGCIESQQTKAQATQTRSRRSAIGVQYPERAAEFS